jgi:hypothetical protein
MSQCDISIKEHHKFDITLHECHNVTKPLRNVAIPYKSTKMNITMHHNHSRISHYNITLKECHKDEKTLNEHHKCNITIEECSNST